MIINFDFNIVPLAASDYFLSELVVVLSDILDKRKRLMTYVNG